MMEVALSRRCREFLLTQYLSNEIRGSGEIFGNVDAGIQDAGQGNAGGVLKGAVFPIYGGDLYGWCCIGTRRPTVHSVSGGMTFVQVAEHADAQCALVMLADGKMGVSWSGEFLSRYSHMTHFLEAAAVWADFVGWRYVDMVEADVEPVLRQIPGCELIATASGEWVRWWANEDFAIYAEPRLADPAVSPSLHLTVLTRTESQVQALSSRLREEIPGRRPEFFLEHNRVVGDGYPEVPGTWGSLTRMSAVIDMALGHQA